MSVETTKASGGLKAAPAGRVKRSRASLIGGIGSGIGVAILAVLVGGGATPTNIVVGLAMGTALATWVRLADL